MSNDSMGFISGSSNFWLSTIETLDFSVCNQHPVHEKEHADVKAVKNHYHHEKYSHM